MIGVILIGIVLVVASVFIHQYTLSTVTKLNGQIKADGLRMPIGVLGCFIAHFAEVVMFAIAYFCIEQADGMGKMGGACDGLFYDCLYFSLTTYTTLGYGDIFPVGDLRVLTGIEAITGILMAAWSTSFLFFKMKEKTNIKQKSK